MPPTEPIGDLPENRKAEQSRTIQGRFAKGTSGNPGGRPTGTRELAELCRDHAAEAIACLLAVMRESANPSVRVAAAREILDRGFGKCRAVEIDSRPVSAGPTWLELMEQE